MTDTLLDVRGLTIGYGSRRGRTPNVVVKGIDFSIAPREVLAIVGESGSGKTTAARAVVGLVRPWGGTMTFGPRADLLGARRSAEQRRRIQMVFQDPRSSLNPRMSIESIVAEPWRAHRSAAPAGSRRAAVSALLDQVGLPSTVIDKRPGQLSGGQCQRVSIARALSLSPELLVCDEAVSALDVSVQAQILQLLADLKQERGLSLLFITHDLGVVRQIADRTAVMHDGVLVEEGPTDTIFTSPQDAYTVGLLDAALDLID